MWSIYILRLLNRVSIVNNNLNFETNILLLFSQILNCNNIVNKVLNALLRLRNNLQKYFFTCFYVRAIEQNMYVKRPREKHRGVAISNLTVLYFRFQIRSELVCYRNELAD